MLRHKLSQWFWVRCRKMDKYLSDEEEKTVEHKKTIAIQVLLVVGKCML